jgi:hypothetical protein
MNICFGVDSVEDVDDRSRSNVTSERMMRFRRNTRATSVPILHGCPTGLVASQANSRFVSAAL